MGMLICNDMEFRCYSVSGYVYVDIVDEIRRRDGEDAKDGLRRVFWIRVVVVLIHS